MPYHVAKTDACPADKPWGVMKEGEDTPLGCHASEEEAMAQMRALYANEPMMGKGFLKAEQLSTAKWRVLAIPFGGPFDGKDIDKEFFSPNTDIKPDWFDRRPLVWHHNLDKTMDADPVIGTQEDLEKPTKQGWWATLWLNRSHQYWAEIDNLLRAGKIHGSSGSLPNFVKTDKRTGEILVWPYIEQTLTPTPANPYSVVVAAKAVDHFDEAGIGLSPAVRGLLSDLEGPTADLPPDLSVETTDGDAAAIQRPTSDPRRQRAIRQLVGLAPRLGELTKNS